VNRGTAVQLPAVDLDFLASRGASTQRGNRRFSRSAVLRRSLRILRMLLDHSDPRSSGRLTEDQCRLAVRLLPAAWKLTSFELRHLADFLATLPDLTATAAEAGIEVAPFLAAVASLTLAETTALVDQALQQHGPDAAERGARREG
jgi:hypothetical protein